MSDWLKVGVLRHMFRLPPKIGSRRVGKLADRARAEVGALSDEHRAVHHFVLRELPGTGGPLPPQVVAENLRVPLDRVIQMLDDWEAKKAILFRNDQVPLSGRIR